MINARRSFRITEMASLQALAEYMNSCSSFTLCTGFRVQVGHDTVLLLNDSFGEDGAQEFAVLIVERDDMAEQVESLTVSWMREGDKLLEAIEVAIGLRDREPLPRPATLWWPPATATCCRRSASTRRWPTPTGCRRASAPCRCRCASTAITATPAASAGN